MRIYWGILVALILAVLPAGSSSLLASGAGDGASSSHGEGAGAKFCRVCQCCMERGSTPVPTPAQPVQAVRAPSGVDAAVESFSQSVVLLPSSRELLTHLPSSRSLLSSSVPLFERYCSYLI